ncbi:hypothetical protein MSG28_014339 [Choristoneura fumiferana]|uniref:Uncharacterized protein n=1 Tax=Choristoneura fumiferana TaxID=7141 RepID=A0ACC0JGP4_CHOFU|nr:hypothetical protein MSG28_014339 [Choristoneura fumiferana]
MAVTRRGYIFGAFLSGLLSVILIIVAVSSDSWIVSTATTEVQDADSDIQYGLFRGELILRNFATPTFSTLFKDRGFKPRFASLSFPKNMCEIAFEIYHELYGEGKHRDVECMKFPIRTRSAWELRPKPSYSEWRPVLSRGTYISWDDDDDDDD